MNRTTSATLACAALAIGAAIYAALKLGVQQREVATLTALEARETETAARLTALEKQAQEDEKRAEAVEADNALLKAALVRAQAAQAEKAARAAQPMTREAVDERFRRAQALARNGDPAEALAELQWCWDEGLKRVASAIVPARQSGLTSALGELATRYPPALAVLQERRDALRARVLAGPGGSDAVAEYASVLRALKEDAAILEVFDQVPAGDRRRSTLAIYGSDQLLAARRYAEIMEGRRAATMLSSFELTATERPLPPNAPNPERLRASTRNFAVNSAVKNIEVLAGAGDLANARKLAQRVLEYDGTDPTRAAIQQAATRAGQPGLLEGGGKP